MSLSAKKMGLVVISALFIFSCQKKENIGIQLTSKANPAGVFFTDTIQLKTTVILKNDSLYTNSYLFTGTYHDPIFGDISAEGFTHLKLESENPVITYTSVDSVVMHLNLNN